MSPVDLRDYIDVKERIRLFYERYPEGRLCTGEVIIHRLDDEDYVAVQAFAYRDPTDIHPGTGWSWMKIPGSTNFTRGSEIENTETSAWGRAIGSTGVGIASGIASKDEIDAKSGEATRAPTPTGEVVPAPKEGLMGEVDTRNEWLGDLSLRDTESAGALIGFRIKQGRQSIKVMAQGTLADEIGVLASQQQLRGMNVTCWGQLVGYEYTPKGMKRPVEYKVLSLSRIHGPTFDLPALAQPNEAESDALFDELEVIGA